jgi:hypothetical protein
MGLASLCLTRQHMKGNTRAKWPYYSERQMFLFLHLSTSMSSLIEFDSLSPLMPFLPFLLLSIYHLPPPLSPAPSICTPLGCVISHYQTKPFLYHCLSFPSFPAPFNKSLTCPIRHPDPFTYTFPTRPEELRYLSFLSLHLLHLLSSISYPKRLLFLCTWISNN